MAQKKKQEAATEPKPNIRFVGKAQTINGKTVEAEPRFYISNDNAAYLLPDEAVQKAGFYHPHAAQIVQLFPDLYKHLVEKGK